MCARRSRPALRMRRVSFRNALLLPGIALLVGAAPPAPRKATVVSYNIEALSRGAPAVIATLNALNADVIALQEVDRKTKRSGGVDQPALLGRALGMHVVFAATMPFDDGEYGLALL